MGNGVRRVCQEGSGDGEVGLEREGCTLGFNPDWDGTPIYGPYRYGCSSAGYTFCLSDSGNRK